MTLLSSIEKSHKIARYVSSYTIKYNLKKEKKNRIPPFVVRGKFISFLPILD